MMTKFFPTNNLRHKNIITLDSSNNIP
jgi:hypothetical protein